MTEGSFTPRWTYRSTPRFKIAVRDSGSRFGRYKWRVLGAGFLSWCAGADPSESRDGYWFPLYHPTDSTPVAGSAWSYEAAVSKALGALVPFQVQDLVAGTDLSEPSHEILLQ